MKVAHSEAALASEHKLSWRIAILAVAAGPFVFRSQAAFFVHFSDKESFAMEAAIASFSVISEFENFLPVLTEAELAGLESLILDGGRIEDLVIAEIKDGAGAGGSIQHYLIDGHNRLKIADRFGLQYKCRVKKFASKSDAKLWMIANQMSGRRNLTDWAKSWCRGFELSQLPTTPGRPAKDTAAADETAGELADGHGVGRATLYRDLQLFQAVETIAKTEPEIKRQILAGELEWSRDDVLAKGGIKPPPAADSDDDDSDDDDSKTTAKPEKKKKKKKKKKAGDSDSDSGSEGGDNGEAAAMVDDWGIPVGEHAQEAFANRDKFEELQQKIKECQSLFKTLCGLPGGEYLARDMNTETLTAGGHRSGNLRVAYNSVRNCRPHYSVCLGDYLDPGSMVHDVEKCTRCYGLGWTSELAANSKSDRVVNRARVAHGVEPVEPKKG